MILRSNVFSVQNCSSEQIKEITKALENKGIKSKVVTLKDSDKVLVIGNTDGNKLPGRYFGNLLATVETIDRLGETYDHLDNLDIAESAAESGLIDTPSEIAKLYSSEEIANLHYEQAFTHRNQYDPDNDESSDIEESFFKKMADNARNKLDQLLHSAPRIDASQEINNSLFLDAEEVKSRTLKYIDQLIRRGFNSSDLDKVDQEVIALIPPHLIDSVKISDSNRFDLQIFEDSNTAVKRSFFYNEGLLERSKKALNHNLSLAFENLGYNGKQKWISYSKDEKTGDIKSIILANTPDKEPIIQALQNIKGVDVIQDEKNIVLKTHFGNINISFIEPLQDEVKIKLRKALKDSTQTRLDECVKSISSQPNSHTLVLSVGSHIGQEEYWLQQLKLSGIISNDNTFEGYPVTIQKLAGYMVGGSLNMIKLPTVRPSANPKYSADQDD
jgi:hypothetical protein